MKKIFFILIFMSYHLVLAQNTKEVDSLANLLQKKLSPPLRLDILVQIAQMYSFAPTLSINYANQALPLAEQANKQREMGKIYRILGEAHQTQAAYDKSLESYLKAELIFEQIKDSAQLAVVYNQIGIIFKYQEKYDRALEFYYKALNIKGNQKNKDITAMLNNIGVVYYKKKEYDKAIEITQQSFQLIDTSRDRLSYAIYKGNIGEYLVRKGDFKEGIPKLLSALGILKGTNNAYYEAFMLTFISQAFLDQKKYPQAIAYAKKCFAVASQIKANALIRDACRILKDTYQANKDLANAILYTDYFHAYQDSLLNEKSIQKITQLEMQYDFDKKNQLQKIEQAKKDLAQEKALAQEVFYRDVFLSFFAVMCCIAFFLYRSQYKEHKINILLKEKNKEILKKNEEIEIKKKQLEAIANDLKKANLSIHDQNEEIKQINENLGKLVQERTQVLLEMNQSLVDYAFYNAHKLRAPLATLMGLVFLFQLEDNAKEKDRIAEMIKSASHDLDLVVRQIQEIVSKDAKIFNVSSGSLAAKPTFLGSR
jgi:tetratricopeptide (TPR) repeat protein